MKKILVISQYYFPENFRINDICEQWVKRGHQVQVVTGIPNYPSGKFFKGFGFFRKRKEEIQGVQVKRLPIIPRGHNAVTLALNYLSFVFSGWFWNLFTLMRADLVFVFGVSPFTQALVGVWFAKKRRIPCYVYVQDLWPESVEVAGGIHNKKILKRLGRMVDSIYKKCSKILVSSRSFKTAIENRGIDPSKIMYWPQYAEELYRPMQLSKENRDVFIVMFTGNIGKAQGLDALPHLAKKIKESNPSQKILFTLVGDGRYKDELEEKIRENQTQDSFVFLGRKSPQEIPALLSQADVALVSFAPNELFSKTIPAKLQSYLACGKPIFALADGETKTIIEEAHCGLVAKANDISEAAKVLIEFSRLSPKELSLFGENALRYSQENFDRTKLLDFFDALIE